jgi:O-antigen/teichoic acid export membrane protein
MFRFRLRHVRSVLGHRATVVLADQAAVSIASFGTSIFLSRTFAAQQREQLGFYYLAGVISILIGELQNALVSTPHMVVAPTLDPTQLRRFNGSSLIHHIVLSMAITLVLLVIAIAAPALGIPSHEPMLLACAVVAGAIGLRNFARFLNLALHRPGVACLGDSVVTAVQLAGIALLRRAGWLSAWSAVSVVGLASLAGGAMMLLMSRRKFRPRLSLAWHDFRANWRLSRWVFASGVIGNAGVSLYPWIIDRLSSTLQAALWGNCNSISSVGNPLMMGLQNWIGPSVSHAYARDRGAAFRRHVFRSAMLFLLILPPTLLALALIATPMLRHLYHDDTPHVVLPVLLLAAGSVVQSANFVFTRGLFTRGRGGLDVWANVTPLVILLTVGCPLVKYHGAVGGAIGLLIAQIVGLAVRGVIFWKIPDETPRTFTVIEKAKPAAVMQTISGPLSPVLGREA